IAAAPPGAVDAHQINGVAVLEANARGPAAFPLLHLAALAAVAGAASAVRLIGGSKRMVYCAVEPTSVSKNDLLCSACSFESWGRPRLLMIAIAVCQFSREARAAMIRPIGSLSNMICSMVSIAAPDSTDSAAPSLAYSR